jgi:hypothetical protein
MLCPFGDGSPWRYGKIDAHWLSSAQCFRMIGIAQVPDNRDIRITESLYANSRFERLSMQPRISEQRGWIGRIPLHARSAAVRESGPGTEVPV